MKFFKKKSQAPLMKLIVGPCVIESLDHSFMMAEKILEATKDLPVDVYYKSSFDKANRSSNGSFRGVGMKDGLAILKSVSFRFGGLKILTDVHETWQCREVAAVADVLQIPAFLCRQTDLILEAGKTGKIVNVKKGQFMSAEGMKNVLTKAYKSRVWFTERGTTFGYNDLVVDFRNIVKMKEFGIPIIFDATHSVQQTIITEHGTKTGGQRQFIEPLAKAARAVGVDGIFIETHNDPDNAPSDGANMLPVNELRGFLERILSI